MANMKKSLLDTQKKCMKALFRYQAGMMCLSCDADYAKHMKTDTTTGVTTVTVKDTTCTNLKKACFKYL